MSATLLQALQQAAGAWGPALGRPATAALRCCSLHRALHTTAAASRSGSTSETRDGLQQRYINLDELEADAKPLLSPQVQSTRTAFAS